MENYKIFKKLKNKKIKMENYKKMTTTIKK